MLSQDAKGVLVIAYVFPPYPGVGGRRWAKFVKYFSRHGNRVHVICAKNPFDHASSWMQDLQALSVNVHALPSFYPAVLQTKPATVLQKIAYRAWLLFLNLYSVGNRYERALFWKSSMISKAAEIIQQEHIRNVIVTGPPFYCLHHSLDLKKKFPAINLIMDIRDMWTDNQSFLGYSALSAKRLAYEQQLEKEVMNGADVVVSVAEAMTKRFKARCENHTTRFETILNGFDSDDFQGLDTSSIKNSSGEHIRMVFTGTLYQAIDSVMMPFVDALKRLKEQEPNVFSRLQFDFYGDAPQHYRDLLLNSFPATCRFHKTIPLKEMFARIAEAHYTMLFLADDHTFSTSSKFFEYMAMKKKVLVFSKQGELGTFVEREKIGIAITPDSMDKQLLRFVAEHDTGNQAFPASFDVNRYSVESLASEFEKLLI